jgi:hypothetical protein
MQAPFSGACPAGPRWALRGIAIPRYAGKLFAQHMRTRSACTFQRSPKALHSDFVSFFMACQSCNLRGSPKTQLKRVPTTESIQYPPRNRFTSAHFGYLAILVCPIVPVPCDSDPVLVLGRVTLARPTTTPDVYPCPTIQNVGNYDWGPVGSMPGKPRLEFYSSQTLRLDHFKVQYSICIAARQHFDTRLSFFCRLRRRLFIATLDHD